ncbi:hypothetical protein F4604DRAFT_1916994 [Suillus subluteus]|nr:hypothetical protein F4604DRAFT_1916994 [Suillus subluteus]
MNCGLLNPSSPTSSATHFDYSSPSHRTLMNTKGKFSFPSSVPPEDVPPMYGSRPPMPLTRGDSSDIFPADFLAQAQTIFNDPEIPLDIIKEAIAAQFATCEKHRNLLMSKMWEVEEINRWKRFSKRTVATLEREHKAAQSGLQIWLDLAERQISKDLAHTSQVSRKEQETLSTTCTNLNTLEGLAAAQGLADADFIEEVACDEDSDEDSVMTDDDDDFVGSVSFLCILIAKCVP